ncbi:MAG TPA: DNA repair protein RecO [Pirellulaceae bacterium]|nr:DNA repair protein RecO [Pirellulaceae bacterium]
MSSEKTTALVIRLVDFSESSCIVTLFTRDFGKISGLAKGARRPKSAFESALDLLAVCRIVFLHKSTDALDLLTEAKLERRFRSASRDLGRLYAGFYLAELLNDLTEPGDPHPELFDATNAALQALDESGDVAAIVARFELCLLRYVGQLPELEHCVECGGPYASSGRVSFGQLAGGVLCQRCRAGKRQIVSVSAEVMAILRELAKSEQPWNETTVPKERRGELRSVLNHYMTNLIGRRPRMYAFLGTAAG